jgi:TatD DNase family protein
MLVDSHCHLDRVNLKAYDKDFARFMAATAESGVGHMLCVSIDLEHYPKMRALVDPYPQVSVSVGVHPNEPRSRSPGPDELVELARDPRNVAIGETGLDYYRSEGDLRWQQQRFRDHIAAARACGKPLIVHTRDAREDTIRILREERAEEAGGVLHCFTEDWGMASRALDLGFSISFSGIVTFANAADLREVAAKVPLDRMLIETDSPYLTPVPFRGRPNEPKYVSRVAQCIAELRDLEPPELIAITGENFFRLFPAARSARDTGAIVTGDRRPGPE